MSSCNNPTHDHFEPCDAIEDHGGLIVLETVLEINGERVVPYRCHDCGAPAHYDTASDQYRHDELDRECFLVAPFELDNNPCTFAPAEVVELDRSGGWSCPCGFDPSSIAPRFSRLWYIAHRDQHLAAYPDSDKQTRSFFEGQIASRR